MRLRDYQIDGIERIRALWQAGAVRVLAVAPTGGGKNTMAVAMLHEHSKRRRQSLFMVHRVEIVSDLVRRLADVGIRAGQIVAGHAQDPSAPVQVATIQTARTRDMGEFDLVILDEAHHFAADAWKEAAERIRCSRVVGLTATPERADGRPLGDMFDTTVNVVSYSTLLDAGHIVPCKVVRPAEELERRQQAIGAVAAYSRFALGESAFCFTNTVEEATSLSWKFGEAGIRACVIHHKTPGAMRRAYLDAFRSGEIKVIVNVYTMTEGIDIPMASCAILTKACDHASTYMQMSGRVLRAHPGKTRAIILDLAGTSYKHGSPVEDRQYSLHGTAISIDSSRDSSVIGNKRCEYEVVDAELVDAGYMHLRTREAAERIAKRRGLASSWVDAVAGARS